MPVTVVFIFSKSTPTASSLLQARGQRHAVTVEGDKLTFAGLRQAEAAFLAWFAVVHPTAELTTWTARSVEGERLAEYRAYLPVTLGVR